MAESTPVAVVFGGAWSINEILANIVIIDFLVTIAVEVGPVDLRSRFSRTALLVRFPSSWRMPTLCEKVARLVAKLPTGVDTGRLSFHELKQAAGLLKV